MRAWEEGSAARRPGGKISPGDSVAIIRDKLLVETSDLWSQAFFLWRRTTGARAPWGLLGNSKVKSLRLWVTRPHAKR